MSADLPCIRRIYDLHVPGPAAEGDPFDASGVAPAGDYRMGCLGIVDRRAGQRCDSSKHDGNHVCDPEPEDSGRVGGNQKSLPVWGLTEKDIGRLRSIS